MRVPPDQSCTPAVTLATATSGSRWRSQGVMRVSRVPKTKVSTRGMVRPGRAPNRCAKCSSMRE